jgi:ribosome-associated protein
LEKQARKVVIINIKKLSAVSDYILICSAESDRQVQAIAHAVEDGLRKKGEKALGVEGVSEGKWALLDFNDVVVHIFLEPVRDYYDLEGLWAEAPVTEVRDKVKKAAAKAAPARPSKAGTEKPKAGPRAKKAAKQD